jgi:hypothetical protein
MSMRRERSSSMRATLVTRVMKRKKRKMMKLRKR